MKLIEFISSTKLDTNFQNFLSEDNLEQKIFVPLLRGEMPNDEDLHALKKGYEEYRILINFLRREKIKFEKKWTDYPPILKTNSFIGYSQRTSIKLVEIRNEKLVFTYWRFTENNSNKAFPKFSSDLGTFVSRFSKKNCEQLLMKHITRLDLTL